jgi:hypothetical protein
MTIVAQGPGFVACSFTDAVGSSANGRHHWEFSMMFGPLFTTKDGTVLKQQPQPGSAAWSAFEEWQKELRQEAHLPIPKDAKP